MPTLSKKYFKFKGRVQSRTFKIAFYFFSKLIVHQRSANNFEYLMTFCTLSSKFSNSSFSSAGLPHTANILLLLSKLPYCDIFRCFEFFIKM